MYRITILSLLVSSILFYSCTSNEIAGSDAVDPSSIYFDYQVSGAEEEPDATVMLQYRFGGRNGTTLLLENPSEVRLDGQLLRVDSSKLTGAFYEIRVPLVSFAGKHNIVFKDKNGKEYKEEFDFQPLSFKADIPATLQRANLQLEIEGAGKEEYMRILLTDTSRLSDGINRADTVRNGIIFLSKAEMDRLSKGPVHLQIIREYERDVRAGTPEGGRIAVSFDLRREFTLE